MIICNSQDFVIDLLKCLNNYEIRFLHYQSHLRMMPFTKFLLMNNVFWLDIDDLKTIVYDPHNYAMYDDCAA